MPDHDKLIGIICLDCSNQAPRTGIDDLVEPGLPAAGKSAQYKPAAGDLNYSPPIRDRLQSEKGCERSEQGCDEAYRCRQTEMCRTQVPYHHTGRDSERQPSQQYHLNEQEVQPEAP